MLAPGGDQRLERSLLGARQVLAVVIGRLELHIEIAYRPEPAGDVAEPLPIGLRATLPVGLAEDAPGRPLPARRDPHLVDIFDVDAAPDTRLPVEHPREVEPHDLAAGLGDVVLGQDARGLADDQAGSILPARLGHGRDRGRGRSRGRRRRSGGGRGSAFARAVDRGESGLELARARTPQPGLRFDRGAERGQLGLLALGQLGLELDEPLDDAATLDHIDLVEAQLDTRRGRAQLALAAELADRDALDEWRVAGVLDDEGLASDAGQSTGGATRSAGPSSSSRCMAPSDPSAWASALTDTMVSPPLWRRRTAKPARARAPSAVST